MHINIIDLALTMASAASFTGGGNSAKNPVVMAY